MATRITITKRMLELPVLNEGDRYPCICQITKVQTIRKRLAALQKTGYQLRRMYLPEIIEYDPLIHKGLPEGATTFKFQFLFYLERGAPSPANFLNYDYLRMHRGGLPPAIAFVKGGFLFDSLEQFEQWQRGG